MTRGPFLTDGEWDPAIPLPVVAIGPGVLAWQMRAIMDVIDGMWPGATTFGRDGFLYVWDAASESVRLGHALTVDAALQGQPVMDPFLRGEPVVMSPPSPPPAPAPHEPTRAPGEGFACPVPECGRAFASPAGKGGHLAKAHPGWKASQARVDAAVARADEVHRQVLAVKDTGLTRAEISEAAQRLAGTHPLIAAARAEAEAAPPPPVASEPAEVVGIETARVDDIPPGLPDIDALVMPPVAPVRRGRPPSRPRDPGDDDGLLAGPRRPWQPGEGPIDHYRSRGSSMHRPRPRDDEGETDG